MTVPARLRWLWLTLAIVLLDRATKAWFETQTLEGWRHELIHNFVYLVHSRNPGLAFGILSDSASAGTRIVLILGSIAVIAVLAWLLVTSQSSGALAVAGFLQGAAAFLWRNASQAHPPLQFSERVVHFRSVGLDWQHIGTILITIGGLGPTEDDVTRKVVARVLQRQLVLNDEILAKLQRRFKARQG